MSGARGLRSIFEICGSERHDSCLTARTRSSRRGLSPARCKAGKEGRTAERQNDGSSLTSNRRATRLRSWSRIRARGLVVGRAGCERFKGCEVGRGEDEREGRERRGEGLMFDETHFSIAGWVVGRVVFRLTEEVEAGGWWMKEHKRGGWKKQSYKNSVNFVP